MGYCHWQFSQTDLPIDCCRVKETFCLGSVSGELDRRAENDVADRCHHVVTTAPGAYMYDFTCKNCQDTCSILENSTCVFWGCGMPWLKMMTLNGAKLLADAIAKSREVQKPQRVTTQV